MKIEVPGAAQTEVWGINNDGVVVGMFKEMVGDKVGQQSCFTRAPDGTVTKMPLPAGLTLDEIRCVDINKAKLIVGYSRRSADKPTIHRALTWSAEKGLAFVHFPVPVADGAGARAEFLTGINDNGQMTGYYYESVTYTDEMKMLRRRQVFKGVVLTPVQAGSSASFDDTTYGFVMD